MSWLLKSPNEFAGAVDQVHIITLGPFGRCCSVVRNQNLDFSVWQLCRPVCRDKWRRRCAILRSVAENRVNDLKILKRRYCNRKWRGEVRERQACQHSLVISKGGRLDASCHMLQQSKYRLVRQSTPNITLRILHNPTGVTKKAALSLSTDETWKQG